MSEARFVLNMKSNTLHMKNCHHANGLPKQQIKTYYTFDEVMAESERKIRYCKTCKPDLKAKKEK